MIELGQTPEIALEITLLGLYGMAFSSSIRKEVYRRQKGRCANCDEHFPVLQTHHRKPHCQGGSDEIENAVGLCPPPPEGNGCHREADELALKAGIIYPQIFNYQVIEQDDDRTLPPTEV